ncbi:hypothetical protein CUMW_177640, partial [Citrus unshiu]
VLQISEISANLEPQLTLEFGGGLELLCDSVKVHNVDVVPPK